MRGTIKKRGKDDKSWSLIYDVPTDNGKRKQKWVSFKGTRREAENELARLITEAAGGNYVDPCKMTVKELLERYLDGNEHWRKKTRAGYTEKINNYIIPHLGKVLIDKLTATQIDKFLKTIQKKWW